MSAPPLTPRQRALAAADRPRGLGTGHLDARAGAAVRGAALGLVLGVAVTQVLLQDAGFGSTAPLLLALAGGAVLGALERERVLRVLTAGVALVVLVVILTPVMLGPARSLVRRDVAVLHPETAAPGTLPSVDAVFVLSASVTASGLVRGQGIDRLLGALAWSRALARPLVVSVVRVPGEPDAVPSLADQRRLAALAGVAPPLAVDSVFSTRDEAVRVAALARARGWRRLLVVTSPLHTRRACAAFERVGLQVVCAPAPSRDVTLDGPLALRGPTSRLRAFTLWLYETAARVEYGLRGWT